VVKSGHKLAGDHLATARAAVGATVDYLRGRLGEETWRAGMNPEVPETQLVENPYQYTDYSPAR
jgi:hypothetical protein